MTSSRDGYLPPGCTQRECDEAQPGYWDEPEDEEMLTDDREDYICITYPEYKYMHVDTIERIYWEGVAAMEVEPGHRTPEAMADALEDAGFIRIRR